VRAFAFGLIAATLIAVLAWIGLKREQPAIVMLAAPTVASLQKYWQVPDFTLTERSGKPSGRADLLGHVWIGAFVYTTCPGPCGTMTSRLAALDKGLAIRPDVRIAAFTLDPETDTPEVLSRYASDRGASDRWLFFTGERAAIHKLAFDGFKLSVQDRQAGAEPIIHSTKLVLVDREGFVRGFYEGAGNDENERLLSDIEKLRAEQP
jgi:protein SCO1